MICVMCGLWLKYVLYHELNFLWSLCVNAAGIMAGLHSDDPVSARGILHPGGLHSDDRVGERETPQLPEGVPRLSHAPLSHPSLHPVGQSRSIPLVFLTFLLSSSSSSLFYTAHGLPPFVLHPAFVHCSSLKTDWFWIIIKSTQIQNLESFILMAQYVGYLYHHENCQKHVQLIIISKSRK